LTCATIPQIAFIGKISLHLHAHLAPPWDCQEGSGGAFFLRQDARCNSLPSLCMVQLFSDDMSGLLHHLEIGPVALSQSGLWHWHSAVGRASCAMALKLSQPNSYLSNAKANNTRVETPWRPQWVCLGNRWASWRSMVATEVPRETYPPMRTCKQGSMRNRPSRSEKR